MCPPDRAGLHTMFTLVEPPQRQAMTSEDAGEPEQKSRLDERRASGSGLRWHALALLALLLALIPVIDNGSYALPDEALYAAQAQNLSDGSWASVRPALDIDKDGRWTPLIGSTTFDDKIIPYGRRPLYPMAITPFWKVGGTAGALLLSVFGTWVAAVCTAAGARRLDRRATLPTLWLVGIGSPLLFDAYLIMGHSLAAGLSAVLSLSVLGWIQRAAGRGHRSLWWTPSAGASAFALTLVRTEGTIVVVALAAGLVIATTTWKQWKPTVNRPNLGFALLVTAAGAAAFRLNNMWARSILPAGSPDPTVFDRQPDILKAAWYDLLRPWYPDNTTASATMTLVLVGAVVGPLVFRFVPRLKLLGLGLICLAAVAAVLRATEYPDLISGLFPTVPWIIIGLIMLSRTDLAHPGSRMLATAVPIGLAAIVATSYGIGGAAQWGGRFFHVLIPLAAPIAVLGLLTLRSRVGRVEARVATGAIIVMTAALAVAGIRTNILFRNTNGRYGELLRTAAAEHHARLVVFVRKSGDGVPRFFWQLDPDHLDVLAAHNPLEVQPLLGAVPADEHTVIVSTDVPTSIIAVALKRSGSGWEITDTAATPDGSLEALVVERL